MRKRNHSRKSLSTLHEEEPLQHFIEDAYQLAIGTLGKHTPLNESLREQIQEHMEESVIMSLSKHTPYTSNDVVPAIRAYLNTRDVRGNIVKSRYLSRIRRRLGGAKRRKTRRRA
jgi:hypothetical protein